MLHIVSAWASANRLVIGQVKTDDKSNEIPAIPTLLDKLALKGSIDAMGCQYKIADKIVNKEGRLPADAKKFAKAVRSHWGIEKSLHYVLDVAFAEDASCIRTDKGPENMSFIRKIALTIARCDTQTERSVAGRIKQMVWSHEYLEQLLFTSSFAFQQSA